jgi:hypothetical protein
MSDEVTPTHTYEEPGFYTVVADMATSHGPVNSLTKGLVSVEADTVDIGEGVFDGNLGCVEVRLRNYVPVEWLALPISYDGPLDIRFDSVSIVGTRSAAFQGVAVVDNDPVAHRAAIRLYAMGADPIEPGDGSVARLHFTYTGGEEQGVTPVEVADYSTYALCANTCAGNYVPDAVSGGLEYSCCAGQVGDANGTSGDMPTIGDVSAMIDAKFITGNCDGMVACLAEADIDQSGGFNPTCDDITISDVSQLIDYLFITGPESMTLPECL